MSNDVFHEPDGIVVGKSNIGNTDGVVGIHTAEAGIGVHGVSNGGNGVGVLGFSASGGVGVQGGPGGGFVGFLAGRDPLFNEEVGVFGQSREQGVFGASATERGTGVYGNVMGAKDDPRGAGVRGETTLGVGVQGQAFDPAGLAGKFIGDVEVTGDIRLVNGQDCAEDFNVSAGDGVEPGTVMVLNHTGALEPCSDPYDKRVGGVISGAGDCKPGIILGRQESSKTRMPIALLGKVYCKVDAEYSPVEVGDLLTTSATSGHAMKAQDRDKAFGAVIGKALRPLTSGQGLIPILIALQ